MARFHRSTPFCCGMWALAVENPEVTIARGIAGVAAERAATTLSSRLPSSVPPSSDAAASVPPSSVPLPKSTFAVLGGAPRAQAVGAAVPVPPSMKTGGATASAKGPVGTAAPSSLAAGVCMCWVCQDV